MAFVTGAEDARATVAFAAKFCAWKAATVQSVKRAATVGLYGTSPGQIARMLIVPSSTGAAAAVAPTKSSAASRSRADAAIVALLSALWAATALTPCPTRTGLTELELSRPGTSCATPRLS